MKYKFENLKNIDLSSNKCIPFWSWNNELDKNELVKQIHDMKTAGCGGFIMHARTGLKDEYLSDKWFDCIGECLKTARELNMEAWIYDENGWPSGFVGGKLLQNFNYRARFLIYNTSKSFDRDAFCCYIKKSGKYIRIYKPIDKNVIYHNIYLKVSPANTDILKPEVVDEFISQTHEEYYKRFKDSFGKELVGFFTDEPQAYRYETPYSDEIAKCLKAEGINVLDNLIYLFVNNEEGFSFKYKYYLTLNKLYVTNFYKKIYEWCEKHNCKLTGHSIEERDVFLQMLGGAGVMPTYEYEHIPGIDWLGNNIGMEISPKQLGSVVSQLGKKYSLIETFACSGYNVTPRELKEIGEYMYFCGASKMCQHLYPYSLAGQAKFDFPPCFSTHNNWFDKFKVFNDYFDKLGYIVSNTEEIVDVAILHPLRGEYLFYLRKNENNEYIKEIETAFYELLNKLRKNGVKFHFIDESILEKYGTIIDNKLVVGKCSYNIIIIPKMSNISSFTYKLLKQYTGKILLEGDLKFIDGVKNEVELQSNISFDEIVNNVDLYFRCSDNNSLITVRQGDIGNYIFIKNLSVKEKSVIRFKDIANNYLQLDLTDDSLTNINDIITLKPNGSIILYKDNRACESHTNYQTSDISNSFKMTNISDNYLVLDKAQLSYDGKNYESIKDIQQIFENLLYDNFKGDIYIKQIFEIKNTISLNFVMEKANLKSIKINDKDIVLNRSPFDVNFVQADITKYIKTGKNEIVYSLYYYQHEGVHFALFDPLATESVRNCLYFDCSIENSYLIGDFVLDTDFSLTKKTTLPDFKKSLHEQGYQFFKGEYEIKGNYFNDGIGEKYLKLNGFYLVADVFINGNSSDIVLSDTVNITKYLNLGNNEIMIIVKSSLRNVLGPHHYKNNLFATCPDHFTMRGQWHENLPKDYTANYVFEKFCINSINVITVIDELAISEMIS